MPSSAPPEASLTNVLARTFVRLASGGALDGIAYDAIYARPKNIAIKLDYNF